MDHPLSFQLGLRAGHGTEMALVAHTDDLWRERSALALLDLSLALGTIDRGGLLWAGSIVLLPFFSVRLEPVGANWE